MRETRKRFTMDLEVSFQRRLKVIAALKGVTMREYCLGAVERQLEVDESTDVPALPFGKEALDRLESLRADVSGDVVLPDDSADFLRQTREEKGLDS